MTPMAIEFYGTYDYEPNFYYIQDCIPVPAKRHLG